MLTCPLPAWGFSGLMKQQIQIKHNKVKNPSGQEANQLAILNSGRAPAGGRRAANLIGPRD